MESLVLDGLQRNFDDAYGQEQHGFRKNASTTTALLRLHDEATKLFDDLEIPGFTLISFDLSSAFDCVNHNLSLKKMFDQGFPIGFVKWFHSYLHNRCSVLKINSKLAKTFVQISKGVPQGSVLGPSVFSLYTRNFSAASPHARIVKYADDLSLVVPLRSVSSDYIQHTVGSEVSNASRWCSENDLLLNKNKTKCFIFSRHSTASLLDPNIEKVSSMRLLGVHVNDKLTWDSHIDYLRVSCSRRLHILRRLRGLVPREKLHLVYEATIRSLMDYACPVFIGLTKKQRTVLNTISKRAHKIINYGYLNKLSCGSCDLQNRRLSLSVKLWYKIEKNPKHLLYDLIPPKHKHSKQYRITYFRTNKRGNSFFPFIARHLNTTVSR